MQGVALIAHFAGDPDDLTPRIRDAARRYSSSRVGPQPTNALLLRNKDGVTAVFAWPEGASLQPFRTFLRGALEELGLPHPRVEHYRADAAGWDSIQQTA